MTAPSIEAFAFPGTTTPAQLLYGDLASELATTRRMLERVPEGRDDWKPHDKSMSLGALATHLAELPGFASVILNSDELDFGTFVWSPTICASNAERLALFDEKAGAMTAAVEVADWNALAANWTMRAGDQVFVKGRKATLLRTLGLSHMAHHRAQLGVYLRQLDQAIPGCYGPSADEMGG